ncbi:orotate phosphoribosyltransferase [Theileria orientalis]|uniref:orotate phosphoribosyltransferase n=1 Tax=Theileria orientalis TaxID=68886 RepID=A0A976M9A7_THEOR|nr:orotate phosphoribosyltransferase [Theileria orientalis]
MEIQSFLKNIPEIRSKFIELCEKNEALLFGEFVMNCGLKSNMFFNSGLLTDAESFDLMTDLLVAKLIEEKVEFDGFIGCPYKAIPIVSAMCLKYYKLTGKKVYFGYHRKEVKDHGEGKLFVGSKNVFEENARLVVVDDVCTTGMSVMKSVSLIDETKAKTVCILFLLNREENYGEFAKRLARPDVKVLDVLKIQELSGTEPIKCW